VNATLGTLAGLLVAFASVAGVWLTWRTKGAKREALEKMVADATAAAEKTYKAQLDHVTRNFNEQIARSETQHREQVGWLQGQIKYYQEMSAPTRRQRPDRQPPDKS
jgi:hypothetical protein